MKTLRALAASVVVLFPTCVRATPAKPALEVVVLGSGGPRAFGRAGSSYIVLVEGRPRILVDAGPGAFLRIGELELDLEKADTVLLTHLHIDHSGDLAAFFNARALTSGGPITYRVFGPDGAGLFPKTSRFVNLLVGEDGAFAYQTTFGARESFTVRDLAINLDSARTKIVDEDGLVVEEIATHHGDCPSVAYRISYKNAVVVVSGDMDASALPNLVQLARNADLLIFNCAVLDPPGSPSQLYDLHTPPKKIGEAARESGVKRVCCSAMLLRTWKERRLRCGNRFVPPMQGRLRSRAISCTCPLGSEREIPTVNEKRVTRGAGPKGLFQEVRRDAQERRQYRAPGLRRGLR